MHSNAKQMFENRYGFIFGVHFFLVYLYFLVVHITELNLLRALSWMAGGFDWLGKAYCLQLMVWNAAFCESTMAFCSVIFTCNCHFFAFVVLLRGSWSSFCPCCAASAVFTQMIAFMQLLALLWCRGASTSPVAVCICCIVCIVYGRWKIVGK